MLAHDEIRTIISSLGTGIGADEFNIEKCRYGKVILMTDADVDGAHIRTLLLTFFFRQMPQLFANDMIYIAQPPLYEIKIKGKKKSEYILSENQMHKRMIASGLDGTEMIIKGEAKGKSTKPKQQKIEGDQLTEFVKDLAEAEQIISVLARRGIVFVEFVSKYYQDKQLPPYRIHINSQDEFFYKKTEYEKQLAKLKDNNKDGLIEAEELIDAEELHEVMRMNEINAKLDKSFGLDLTDFLLKQQRSVSGETLPTKFQLVNGENSYEIASLGDVCAGVRQLGGRGVEIKRFKGLGEMNADQLWDTTMDPTTRTLLKVTIDDAGEADRLFSILMGSNVEERRNFIQEHALEVQNLDV